jgi:hypothetical protein
MSSQPGYKWRFFRAGGFDQVKLSSGADLANLELLDQKLWVALACPTKGLDLDPRTATLIDTDKDGRIRVPELIEAVKFATRNLVQPDDLLKGAAELPLASINAVSPDGATLLGAAKQVLRNLGRGDRTAITVEEFGDPTKLFADTKFNGDGVIIPESAADDETKKLIEEIAACMGTAPDRSGKAGITQEKVDAFFAEAREHDAWFKEGDAALFLGYDKTAAAVDAVDAIRAKVDDYFVRCRVAAFDPRTAPLLNRTEDEYRALLSKDMGADGGEMAAFPLAQAAAGRPLPLAEGVNPAHAEAVAALARDAVRPVLGDRTALTEADWRALEAKLEPFTAWKAAQRGGPVAGLGIDRVRAILAAGADKRLADLVAEDKALEPEATAIENLERLVRYHRDLFRLCTNFVSFKDFYDGGEPAIFQMGTLYLDQRACKLCLPVDDPARHATMAGLAGAYLAYLDCARPATAEKMQIVAAVTSGDSDNLMVGRNGVFYDRKGRDWDATVTKIIDNPISVKQAFFSPYKKFVRMIEEQVAKRASAAEGETQKQMGEAAADTANLDKAKPPPPPAKIDVGTVAALGVAFGAIGTFATAIVGYATGVLKLGLLATLAALVGIVLLISTPSVVLAYIKLRKRNLGPILDANGWAINTRARINVPFGSTLTAMAQLPAGARRDTNDQYAEKTFPFKTVITFMVLSSLAWGWYHGRFDRLLPEPARSTEVLGKWAPAPAPPPSEPPPAEKPQKKP